SDGEWLLGRAAAALRPLHAEYVDRVRTRGNRAAVDAARPPAPEPHDRRVRLLVPAPGERQHCGAGRLRRPAVRQHHDAGSGQGVVRARIDQLLRGVTTMKRIHALATLGAVALLVCSVAAQTVQINGAGATFPNPIYSKWFDEYGKLHSNVRINY